MTTVSDLHYMTLLEVSALIRQKLISPVEVAEAQLSRIERLNPVLHAYNTVTADLALAQARQAESEILGGDWKGPLHGIPVGIKDLAWTKGVATAAGTTIQRDFIPDEDATVVRRLRHAGAVILGKLQLTEGAFSEHHPDIKPPVNPWNAGLWPGVSSSGSGVAAAAGLAYATLGTDTGGSIRFPCGANGLTGLKPTWGRVSRHGTFELAATLDHVGPITRTAADAAAILGAIAGADDDDLTAADIPVPDYLLEIEAGISGLRIGIDRAWNETGTDADAVHIVDAALAVLRSLGAHIVDVAFPDVVQNNEDWGPLCAVQTAVAHEATFPQRQSEYGPVLANLIRSAREVTAFEYHRILLRREAFRSRVSRLFRDIDLLIVPAYGVAGATNAALENFIGNPVLAEKLTRYTFPFNASGHPTLSLNGGFTRDGAPVGFQLVGAAWQEALLLRAGHAFQRETGWHRQHPAI